MLNFKILMMIASSILILSCSSSPQNINDIEKVETIAIKSTKYKEDLIIYPPQSLSLWKDLLLISDGDKDGFFTFCNKEDLSIKIQWGRKGAGPEEFTSPQYVGVLDDNNFYAYDFNLRQLYSLEMDKNNQMHVLFKKKLKDNDLFVTNLHIMNEDYILGSVLMGRNEPIALFDKNLNIIGNFGKITKEECNEMDMKSYVGRFASQKEYFVHAMNDFGYLGCYKMNNGTAEKQWEFYAEEPIFDDGYLNKRVLKDGFWDVEIYNDKVYAIYNGKTFEQRRSKEDRFPNIILSFDLYSGKLCKKYVTDRDICRFTIGEEGTIYGVGTNPEVEIVRYELPDFSNRE